MTTFYNFSGGMESAAMLVVDRERIRSTQAIVRWADTGKQFPEMYESISQIESILGISIARPPRYISFEEFLFERGGILRKGTTDCSRRMKRSNLTRHMKTFPKPYEVNLGYNNAEDDRAAKFIKRNERSWLHWRFPLIEADVSRDDTWDICRGNGFTILVSMYEKMGRMDCWFCPNQTPQQARKVAQYYPNLGAEWLSIEARKGHAIMRTPFHILTSNPQPEDLQESAHHCACFGGDDDMVEDEL